MLASVTDEIEKSVWQSIQHMEEAIMLLKQVARGLDDEGRAADAKVFDRRADGVAAQAEVLHRLIGEPQLAIDVDASNVSEAKRATG